MPTITTNQNTNYSNNEGQFIPVKVVDVVLDLNFPEIDKMGGWDALGTILFIKVSEIVKDPEIEFNRDKKSLISSNSLARPLFANSKYYPLKGEIVLIYSTLGRDIINDDKETYYIPNINIWNHPHHNALPNPDLYNDQTDKNKTQKDYINAAGGLVRQVQDLDSEIELGGYFREQLNVKPLLPFEGDHIIEGRFGNSIRFGATAPGPNDWSSIGQVGDPITIIRNGQAEGLDMQGWVHTLEDINLDASSIYLTSNQKIDNFVIAAPDCWYSFGLNTVIPQDPNQEAKKFLDSPVDFVQANEDESVEDIEETKAGSNNQSIINQNQRITEQIDPTFEQDEETNNSTIQYNNTEFVQENQDSNIISEEEIENENYNEEKLDSIQSNLFTKGGEYLLNGENYVGPYHIHPDKGAMAGAQHIPQTHYFLEPVVGYSPGPYVNVIGKYFDGVGKNKEFNEAENLARQDALSKVYSKIGNTNVNVIFGESFQTKTPTRYINDGELEVYYTYKVESIV